MSLLYRLAESPVIAALRDARNMRDVLESGADICFIMGGTINGLREAVSQAKTAGIGTFVHVDLIKGLSRSDKEAVEFIASETGADGSNLTLGLEPAYKSESSGRQADVCFCLPPGAFLLPRRTSDSLTEGMKLEESKWYAKVCYLFDLDGCIYFGSVPAAGAGRLLAGMRRAAGASAS